MKKLFLSLVLALFASAVSFAGVPQYFNYHGVVTEKNSQMAVIVTIIDIAGDPGLTQTDHDAVYSETHVVNTNANGAFSPKIGSGTRAGSAKFKDITINGTTYKLGVSGAIDLGLSVKWATCNVGATAPGEYGDYYAWGETETKSDYRSSTYFDSNYDIYATNKETKLRPEHDVAHVKLGGDWRMPTDAELTELRTKCTWKWTQYGGHNGYVVIGSTGNAIFLPAAGSRCGSSLYSAGSRGYYWSSSLSESYSSYAWYVGFYSSNVCRDYDYRYCGFSVRPVCPQN